MVAAKASCRGRSRAHTMRKYGTEHVIMHHARSCQRVRHYAPHGHTATDGLRATCGRTLSNVPWRNVTLTHSLARTHSAQTNAHPAGAMRPWAGARAHAPHTFTHGPAGRGSQASSQPA